MRQTTDGMLEPGRRKSQPGTLPTRKLTSVTSWVVGRAAPCRSSSRTAGNGPATELGGPGEGGDACAIPAIRTICVVPSTGAADGTAPSRRLDTIYWFLERPNQMR